MAVCSFVLDAELTNTPAACKNLALAITTVPPDNTKIPSSSRYYIATCILECLTNNHDRCILIGAVYGLGTVRHQNDFYDFRYLAVLD